MEKHVSNKVLLAMPDHEYQLMRPDLTYTSICRIILAFMSRRKASSSSIFRTEEWFLKL